VYVASRDYKQYSVETGAASINKKLVWLQKRPILRCSEHCVITLV